MNEVINSIEDGNCDDDLAAILDAVRLRQKTLAARQVRDLSPGDTVRFSDAIRPKYLVGKTATVVKLNRQTVVVDCPDDPSYGRFSGSSGVRCPNSLIEGREESVA
jgi:hypothetical protein